MKWTELIMGNEKDEENRDVITGNQWEIDRYYIR